MCCISFSTKTKCQKHGIARASWSIRSFPSENLIHGYPLLGGMDWLENRPDASVFVAVGDCVARRSIVRRMKAKYSNTFATLIHPRASVESDLICGEGTIVCAGSVLSTEVVVGDQVMIADGCAVSHNAVIGAYCTLATGVKLAGRVTVEEGVSLGVGVAVLPDKTIGSGAILGGAACVTRDIPPDCVAVGVPAKPIKVRRPSWSET